LRNLVVLLALVMTSGCGGVGAFYTYFRVKTRDDVVLVKGSTNVLYPRFVRNKLGVIPTAPKSLLARKTGVLNRFNQQVRAGEVVVFDNYEAAKKSGVKFEEDVTLTNLFKQAATKKRRFWQRIRRRKAEDTKYGNVPDVSWRG